MQQYQQHPQRSLVKVLYRLGKFGVTQERSQVLEQMDQQLRIHGPSFLLWNRSQDAADEDPMRYQFQPGIAKTGGQRWSQNVIRVTEGSDDAEADILQNWIVSAKLQEQHDENTVVAHLLESGSMHFLIVHQNANYDA